MMSRIPEIYQERLRSGIAGARKTPDILICVLTGVFGALRSAIFGLQVLLLAEILRV